MKRMVLAVLLPAALLFLAACRTAGNPEPVQLPEAAEEGEPMELKAFSFTHTGMSTEECFLYSVEQTEEGIRLYTEELFSGGFILDLYVDEPLLDELGEIAGRHHLDSWDGFAKSDSHVSDGSNFSLSLKLADESTISARGSNRFPEGYEAAKQEICTYFEELIERYGNKYPKTVESDELDYVSLTLHRRTKEGKEQFNLTAYRPPEGKISLYIWIDGYEEFYAPGEYPSYDGYCESFPFDELQNLIRKYDVPSWNGWDKVVEGMYEEWIQMKLGYTSMEEISVMGSLFPENYDGFRTAFLEVLGTFLEENSGAFTDRF